MKPVHAIRCRRSDGRRLPYRPFPARFNFGLNVDGPRLAEDIKKILRARRAEEAVREHLTRVGAAFDKAAERRRQNEQQRNDEGDS